MTGKMILKMQWWTENKYLNKRKTVLKRKPMPIKKSYNYYVMKKIVLKKSSENAQDSS